MLSEALLVILVLGLNVFLACRSLRLSTNTEFCEVMGRLFDGKITIGRDQEIVTALVMLFFGSPLAVLVLGAFFVFMVLWGVYYVVFEKCLKGVCAIVRDEQVVSLFEISFADLKRDNKEMKREGRNYWHIKVVLGWRALTTFVPIACDCLVRIIKAVLPFTRPFKS